MGAIFLEKKKRQPQCTHKLGASRNMGAIFLEQKKPPAATYPQVEGFQDLGTKKKRRAREAEPLGMQGGTGRCKLPAKGSGGLEAPQEQQGIWGAAAPQ